MDLISYGKIKVCYVYTWKSIENKGLELVYGGFIGDLLIVFKGF